MALGLLVAIPNHLLMVSHDGLCEQGLSEAIELDHSVERKKHFLGEQTARLPLRIKGCSLEGKQEDFV